MQVLVSGASGYLGSRLVRSLAMAGFSVRTLGRNHAALATLQSACGAQPFECDLRERDAVIEACRNVEVVYHLGALTAPWAPAHEYHGINVEGTKNILDGCREHGVRRLVLASTLEVLMDDRPQVSPAEPVPYPARPLSELARSKRRAEELVRSAEGIEGFILRLARVYGPGDPHFLPPLARLGRAGKLKQIGSGRNRVELLFRDNAIQALRCAGEAATSNAGTFAITGGEAVYPWSVLRGWLGQLGVLGELPTTTLNVALAQARAAELLAGATGRPPRFTRAQVCWLGLSHTYDGSAAEQALGYRPPIPQDEGIARTMHALSIRD